MQIVDARDDGSSQLENHVAHPEASGVRRTTLDDFRHEHAARCREVADLDAAAGETHGLSAHADEPASDAAVANELRDDDLRRARWNGETNPMRAGDDCRVDADDLTARADEWSARVPRIQRRVGLNHRVDQSS